ncbi:hypothetical protein ACPCTN_04090 [Streptomyces cinereoruber]|uniref:hypothetical protein n=1 Tax=Streptomyces cinereoruber TaxID=67260 RepID=UPI003C2D6D41
MLPHDRVRALLRRHDAPFPGDAPADYDWAAAEERFGRPLDAARERFGPAARTERGQDVSYYGAVVVPAEDAGTEGPLEVRMSNYGPFVAAWTLVGPAPSREETPGAEVLDWLDGVCAALDCVHVPVELLQEEYDGVVDLYGDKAFAAFLETLDKDSPFFASSEGDEEEDEETVPLRWMDRYFAYV